MGETVRMASIAELTVVIWALARRMTPEQIKAACDDLEAMPISRSETVQGLVGVLRQEVRDD